MVNLRSDLSTFGKYIDQPAIIKGLNNAVPVASSIVALSYTAYDTYKAPKEEKKKRAIKDLIITGFTLASAFIATKGLKIGGRKIIKGISEECHHSHHHHHGSGHSSGHKHIKPIDEILNQVKDKKIKGLINKVKDKKYINLSQVVEINKSLEELAPGERLISKVIPDSHIHTPKEMFSELWKLTKVGMLPIAGGIIGGIIADKVNGEDISKTSKNKIKEGLYQYMANITLCNAGAGLALLCLNKLNIKSKAIKFVGMLTGVMTVGVLFGGTIANFVCKNFINPLLGDNNKTEGSSRKHHHHCIHDMFKDLNKERKPELLDLGLHIDDVASVGFLSGLKWIGPILPALYSISGFRAGIGYRNNDTSKSQPNQSKIELSHTPFKFVYGPSIKIEKF